MRSSPLAKDMMWPVRVRAPSPKMQTSSPRRAASAASASAAAFWDLESLLLTGMASIFRANHPRSGTSKNPRYIRNRTGRSVDAAIRTASTKDTWLATSSAPPDSGRRCPPTTRVR